MPPAPSGATIAYDPSRWPAFMGFTNTSSPKSWFWSAGAFSGTMFVTFTTRRSVQKSLGTKSWATCPGTRLLIRVENLFFRKKTGLNPVLRMLSTTSGVANSSRITPFGTPASSFALAPATSR